MLVRSNHHSVIGNVWLYTYEVCNILTDLMLMGYSVALILSVKIAMRQRLKMIFLFSIGIWLIFISVFCIALSQNARSSRNLVLWSSLEVFFAAVVAVTPTIYGLISNHAEKHTSTKPSSVTTSAPRTPMCDGPSESADTHHCHLGKVGADTEKGLFGGEGNGDIVACETSFETESSCGRKRSVCHTVEHH